MILLVLHSVSGFRLLVLNFTRYFITSVDFSHYYTHISLVVNKLTVCCVALPVPCNSIFCVIDHSLKTSSYDTVPQPTVVSSRFFLYCKLLNKCLHWLRESQSSWMAPLDAPTLLIFLKSYIYDHFIRVDLENCIGVACTVRAGQALGLPFLREDSPHFQVLVYW